MSSDVRQEAGASGMGGPGAPAHAYRYRAGDVVLHKPTGNDLILAADERNGVMVSAGWPEVVADREDCQLIRVASDQGRITMLRNAVLCGGTREKWAREDLERSGIVLPPPRQGELFR